MNFSVQDAWNSRDPEKVSKAYTPGISLFDAQGADSSEGVDCTIAQGCPDFSLSQHASSVHLWTQMNAALKSLRCRFSVEEPLRILPGQYQSKHEMTSIGCKLETFFFPPCFDEKNDEL